MNITVKTAEYLIRLWKSEADSIDSQLNYVNAYPEGPVKKSETLRRCAVQLEAAMMPDAINAIIHMSNEL